MAVRPGALAVHGDLGLNRQLGVQLWGNLFENRVDYAIGAFDGPRNSFEDYNEAKDVMAYLNIRPFGTQEKGSLLAATSTSAGRSPTASRTTRSCLVPSARRRTPRTPARPISSARRSSVLEESVRERGQRTFWSAHAAYFYKRFSLFTDYNGGILRYAANEQAPESVDSPSSGYSVAMGYFLTGEKQERRTILEPKRPFSLRPGKFGPGAWELIFRYSSLDFDRDVFTGGLADPDLWSHRAWNIEPRH